jgi:hypothetical protein
MIGLIEAYSESSLTSFHRMFYSEQHDPPSIWPHTYDRFNLYDAATRADFYARLFAGEIALGSDLTTDGKRS